MVLNVLRDSRVTHGHPQRASVARFFTRFVLLTPFTRGSFPAATEWRFFIEKIRSEVNG